MNSQVDETYYDGLHEECGVFGVYDLDGGDVASTIYYGLFALQHRGQESCGIAVSDTKGPKGKVLSSKGMGPLLDGRCEQWTECTAVSIKLCQRYSYVSA